MRARFLATVRTMASIKRRGNSYEVRWRAGRRGETQTCTFHDEKLAETAKDLAEARGHKISDTEVYAAILGFLTQPPVPETSESPYVKDLIEEFLQQKVDVKESTKKEYTRLLHGTWVTQDVGSVPALAGLRVTELDRDKHVNPWKAEISKVLAPASVHKLWAVLAMALRTAVPRYRYDNPFDRPAGQRSNGLPTIERFDAYFLTPEEAEILVAACPPDVRDAVIVALGTGMRLSEIFRLQVGAVSLAGEQPTVRVEKQVKSKKSYRTIGLPALVIQVFARRIAGEKRTDLVFTSATGKPVDTKNFRQRIWRYVVSAAQRCPDHPPRMKKVGNGAELYSLKSMAVSTCDCPKRLHQRPRFHDLRHTYVAYLIAAGFDFLAIRDLLGHASIKTTFDIYGHRLTHGDKRLLDKLNKRLPGGANESTLEEFEQNRRKKLKKKKAKKVAPFIEGMPAAA
jgi:integrase